MVQHDTSYLNPLSSELPSRKYPGRLACLATNQGDRLQRAWRDLPTVSFCPAIMINVIIAKGSAAGFRNLSTTIVIGVDSQQTRFIRLCNVKAYGNGYYLIHLSLAGSCSLRVHDQIRRLADRSGLTWLMTTMRCEAGTWATEAFLHAFLIMKSPFGLPCFLHVCLKERDYWHLSLRFPSRASVASPP
jgi:hypothetical protein